MRRRGRERYFFRFVEVEDWFSFHFSTLACQSREKTPSLSLSLSRLLPRANAPQPEFRLLHDFLTHSLETHQCSILRPARSLPQRRSCACGELLWRASTAAIPPPLRLRRRHNNLDLRLRKGARRSRTRGLPTPSEPMSGASRCVFRSSCCRFGKRGERREGGRGKEGRFFLLITSSKTTTNRPEPRSGRRCARAGASSKGWCSTSGLLCTLLRGSGRRWC